MKFLITILLLVGISASGVAADHNFRDSIVSFASSLTGTPYHYGGCSENGFDCSGFVYYVFKHFSHAVPRTSSAYQSFGNKIELEEAKPGDVMVFTGTNASIRKPGHVGIVLRNNDGVIDFIHASSSKKNYGVTVTRYNDSGYVKRFLSVVNVFDV